MSSVLCCLLRRAACLALLSAVSAVSACRAEPGRRAVARVDGRAISAAELVRSLPDVVSAERDESTQKRVHLDRLVDIELLVAEAERRGLDERIEYHGEVGKKSHVIQEFYRHLTAPARDVSPAALDSAYRDLAPELKLRLMEVESESVARLVEQELARGVQFESLAVRWSELANARAGGELGWLPSLWLEPEVKAEVERLEPGENTRAVPVRDRWQFARVEGRREPDPSPPPLEQLRGTLTVRLRQHRQQILAQEYLAGLRRRLEYQPEGLAVVAKRAEDISPVEEEIPVVILRASARESSGRRSWPFLSPRASGPATGAEGPGASKYVKVGRLMHLLRRFPSAYDSSMRRYAVQREIEEDLIYEEALGLGLDQVPTVLDSVADYRRRLLHQALYEQAITDSVSVSEADCRDWYERYREQFGGADFETAAGHIEERLLRERRSEAYRALLDRLRAGAKVRIDRRVLGGIRQNPDGSWE